MKKTLCSRLATHPSRRHGSIKALPVLMLCMGVSLQAVTAHAAEAPLPALKEAYPEAMPDEQSVRRNAYNNFPDALAHLWETHPEVRMARSNLVAAGYDVKGAYTGFYPYAQLSLSAGSKTDSNIVSFVLPLWRGGATVAGVDAAEAGREAAFSDVNRTRLRLGLRLADAWYAAAAAAEQESYWLTYIESLGRLQGIIKRRADEGAAPYADVINALTRLRQAEALAAQNRSVLDTSRAQLAALLGPPDINASWPVALFSVTDKEAAAALERAAGHHPEILFAQAQLAQQKANARVSRAALSPEVLLQHDKPFGDEKELTEEETRVVVRYQTDNGMRGYQAWRAGQLRSSAAQSGVETAQREVQSAIRAAQAERAAARAQMDFQLMAVRSAEDVVSSFLRQFEVGRKTWLEVLNAQREAHETRLSLVQQKRSYWESSTRLALQGLYWERLLAGIDAPEVEIAGKNKTAKAGKSKKSKKAAK